MADDVAVAFAGTRCSDADRHQPAGVPARPPAGALADIVDRRKLIFGCQIWMLAAALTLAVVTVVAVVMIRQRVNPPRS